MTIKLASIPQPVARVEQYWGDRPMGEVRVKVKLTNVVDAALARQGKLSPDEIRSYEADAVVDTGAVRSVIPRHVADLLEVDLVGTYTAEYADGRKESVPLTDAVRLNIGGRETVEECLVLGDSVLIGQTVLEKTDLLVDCANARLVPNPDHPDQPVSKVRGAMGSSVRFRSKHNGERHRPSPRPRRHPGERSRSASSPGRNPHRTHLDDAAARHGDRRGSVAVEVLRTGRSRDRCQGDECF